MTGERPGSKQGATSPLGKSKGLAQSRQRYTIIVATRQDPHTSHARAGEREK